MTLEKMQRIAQISNRLTESLMTAAICAEEIRTAIQADLGGSDETRVSGSDDAKSLSRFGLKKRPNVDPATYSVLWAGKSCHLGYTFLFRLAERLFRRPNQYISGEQLLRDVWDGSVRSPDTIRSTVRHLRDRLLRAGMADLASAIRGRGGRYGMILDDEL